MASGILSAQRALGSTAGFAVMGSVLAAVVAAVLPGKFEPYISDPTARDQAVDAVVEAANPRAVTSLLAPGEPLSSYLPDQAELMQAADDAFILGVRAAEAVAFVIVAPALVLVFFVFPSGRRSRSTSEQDPKHRPTRSNNVCATQPGGSPMSDTAPSNRKWKIALVATIVVVPLLSTLGAAWASHNFPDVPPTNIFHEEIGWGAEHSIINGYTNGNFGPNDNVNRGQAAAFLSHYNDAIHKVTTTTDPAGMSNSWSVFSYCPPDERAIGGSANTTMNNVWIADQYMNAGTYSVRFETENDELRDPLAMNVTAVCAPNAVAHAN